MRKNLYDWRANRNANRGKHGKRLLNQNMLNYVLSMLSALTSVINPYLNRRQICERVNHLSVYTYKLKVQKHLASTGASLASSSVPGFTLEVTSILLVLQAKSYGFPWLYLVIVLHQLTKFTILVLRGSSITAFCSSRLLKADVGESSFQKHIV